MLNERPLCPSTDEAEQIVLTPAHFCNLGTYSFNPDLEAEEQTPTGKTLTKLIRQDEHYLNHQWKVWRQLYLTHLRDKIPKALPNAYRNIPTWPQVGKVVHVLDSQSIAEMNWSGCVIFVLFFKL